MLVRNQQKQKKNTEYLLDFAYHVEQLVIDDLYYLKTLTRVDRVNQHVAMEVHAVLGREYTVLVLTCSVHQLYFIVGRIQPNKLCES